MYQITNDILTVTITDIGAEVVSIKKNGIEYLYDGNPEFWAGRAPIMFPICGRLFDGKYTYKGKEYQMILHGFVRKEKLDVFSASKDSITFIYKSNEKSKEIYPFDFDFFISYILDGETLKTELSVINLSEDKLPCAFGGHPGFHLPIEDKGCFEDCYVEFESECAAKRIDFTETCFMTGNDSLFSDEKLKVIPLKHNLFDRDAIFLYDTPKSVTLKSKATDTFIRMDFEGFKYIGFWHAPFKEATYVCMEPWTSCPSYDGKVDDFESKKDLFYVEKGEKRTVAFSITISK